MSALPAALYSRKPQALARHGLHVTSGERVSRSLHLIAPSDHSSVSRPEYRREDETMSGGGNTQTLRERVRDALQRRIGKGKAVTVKQVARALYPHVSERTIENLMAGNNEPRAETLNHLISFFDQSFADEVYAGRGFRVVKLADHRAVEAARKIIEGNAELAALEGR